MAPAARALHTVLLAAHVALPAALRRELRGGAALSSQRGCPTPAKPPTCEDYGWPRARRRRRVVDAFNFNGPDSVLQARLSELKSVVNRTAIATSEQNFHGFVREQSTVPMSRDILHWKIPAKDFEACRDMDAGSPGKCWCTQSFAKNSVAEVVELAHLDDEDWVMYSDADEIPDREVVRLLHECEVPVVAGNVSAGGEKLFIRLQAWTHYLYNLRCQAQLSLWTHAFRGPIAMKAKTMRTFGFVHFQFRGSKDCHVKGSYASCWKGNEWRTDNMLLIPCSSWHLSHFGGSAAIMRTTLDNCDPAQLVDFDGVNKCSERNHARNDPYTLLAEPSLQYPDVPHSISDNAAAYPLFMDFSDHY